MKTGEREMKKQESPWSFRPDDDVREMLEFAKSRTRMTTAEMVNKALRKCGAECLDEYFAAATSGQHEFSSRFGQQARAYRVSSDPAAPAARASIPNDGAERKVQAQGRKPEAPAPTVDKPERGAQTPKPATVGRKGKAPRA